MPEKSQTIVCNDLKVMNFQTSKNGSNFVCENGTLLQIQSLIMITEVHTYVVETMHNLPQYQDT